MFRLWKVATTAPVFGLCYAPEDAGGLGGADPGDGGDGSQPLDDPAADDADPDGAAGGDAAREDALEDLLIDDDEEEHGQDRPHQDRIKALAAKNRKLRKRLAKVLPQVERYKGVDVDDLRVRASRADQLEEALRANPRLRARLFGEEEDAPARSARHAPAPEDADFDESTLPFDANETPTNRYFANLAKQNHTLQRTVRQLAERVTQMDGRDQSRTEATTRGQWRTAIDAAAEHITSKGVRTLFKDAVTAAYQLGGNAGKYTPQQIINHYLKALEIDPSQAQAAARAAATAGRPGTTPGADRQRIAERNRTLPRTVAPSGTPAPARSGRGERLYDVHKRVRHAASG